MFSAIAYSEILNLYYKAIVAVGYLTDTYNIPGNPTSPVYE